MRLWPIVFLVSVGSFTPRTRPHRRRRVPWTEEQNRLRSATDWVVEGLTDAEFDTESTDTAGEGDVLPPEGLLCGRVRVVPAGADYGAVAKAHPEDVVVRLGNSANGWGTGCHPSTKLCLEFLSENLNGGESMVDFGCGSAVLALAALHLGASFAFLVDVDAEIMVTAQQNLELNELEDRADLLHVREWYPGGWGGAWPTSSSQTSSWVNL